MVEYHPVSAKDQSRLHQFGTKVLPGFFFFSAMYWMREESGKETLWSQTLKNWRRWTSELHARRLNAKEVLTPQRSGNFIFLVADGTVKTFGGDSVWEHPPQPGSDRNEAKNKKFFKEIQMNGMLHPITKKTQNRDDDEEARNDFWTITGEFICRHHVVRRVKLYVPQEETFPIPMKYTDIARTTCTSLDVMSEKQIEDYRNENAEWELSCMDRFHKICSIERKATWRIYMVREETYKETKKLLVLTKCGQICGNVCLMQQRRKQTQDGLLRNPKFDNARQLSGIFFIEPNDEELKLTMKAARRKLEVPMLAALPCKIPIKSSGETHRIIGIKITSLQKGWILWLTTVLFPMLQAFKIPDAKAAVEKKCEKLKKIPAWQLTKVRNKKEVIDEARNNGRKVQFASLMDLCHLKNSEQKYKGRVVLQGDIVKDDSGAYAVFTEQGSSASQMTAAKLMDIISRLPGCSGQAADAVSAKTQVKMEDAHKLLKILKSECPDIWIRLPMTQMAQIMVQCWRRSCSSWANSVRSSSGRIIMGKAIWESSIGTRLGKSFKLGMFICLPSKTISKSQEKQKT